MMVGSSIRSRNTMRRHEHHVPFLVAVDADRPDLRRGRAGDALGQRDLCRGQLVGGVVDRGQRGRIDAGTALALVPRTARGRQLLTSQVLRCAAVAAA